MVVKRKESMEEHSLYLRMGSARFNDERLTIEQHCLFYMSIILSLPAAYIYSRQPRYTNHVALPTLRYTCSIQQVRGVTRRLEKLHPDSLDCHEGFASDVASPLLQVSQMPHTRTMVECFASFTNSVTSSTGCTISRTRSYGHTNVPLHAKRCATQRFQFLFDSQYLAAV